MRRSLNNYFLNVKLLNYQVQNLTSTEHKNGILHAHSYKYHHAEKSNTKSLWVRLQMHIFIQVYMCTTKIKIVTMIITIKIVIVYVIQIIICS